MYVVTFANAGREPIGYRGPELVEGQVLNRRENPEWYGPNAVVERIVREPDERPGEAVVRPA